ncbi:MAG: DUF1343 domain-containing protein [Thermodesulfobacteriota bacterium]
MVITGVERLLAEPGMLSDAGRLGLLCNEASVDSRFRPAPELVHRGFPGRLVCLFGPQHGIGLTEQDNMIETSHGTHPNLGIPVYSLYGAARTPDPAMLDGVDTVLVDLQDTGTRVYTFATTVLLLMEVCAGLGKAVVILDRPNPINGVDVEGNVLDPEFRSFVGPHPIPMRHGLTLGELMSLYNGERGVGCMLRVVPMQGWNRHWYYEQTGLEWVMPSPNMPLVETAVVYPGQVLLEGTNLSEGRGTTRPFEIFGAPFLQPAEVVRAMDAEACAGAVLREIHFRPTFNKWADRVCRGFQIHVTDRSRFRPYRFTLSLLSAVSSLYPNGFRWSDPPYEYVHDKLPIEVILGDGRIRQDIEEGCLRVNLEAQWGSALEGYTQVRSNYLMYHG